MTTPIIFCDLDGVVADFVGATCKAINPMVNPNDVTEWELHKAFGLPDVQSLWAITEQDPDFWLNIPLYPEAKDFVSHLSVLTEVRFCTSPSRHPNCASHKLAWIEKHFGLEHRLRTVLIRDKYLLAGQGRILVDDYPKNISAWEQAGGIAVCLPQPWNAWQGSKLGVQGAHSKMERYMTAFINVEDALNDYLAEHR